MKDKLIFNNKIEVRRSPVHGYGVFAKEDIKAGEILEETYFLRIPMGANEASSIFIDYRFNFPIANPTSQVIPFGFACIYNHSNEANARWDTDIENELFIFSTIKDIKKDEEIRTYYGGDSYWQEGRGHIKVV